jgi:hypothetical protein
LETFLDKFHLFLLELFFMLPVELLLFGDEVGEELDNLLFDDVFDF